MVAPTVWENISHLHPCTRDPHVSHFSFISPQLHLSPPSPMARQGMAQGGGSPPAAQHGDQRLAQQLDVGWGSHVQNPHLDIGEWHRPLTPRWLEMGGATCQCVKGRKRIEKKIEKKKSGFSPFFEGDREYILWDWKIILRREIVKGSGGAHLLPLIIFFIACCRERGLILYNDKDALS